VRTREAVAIHERCILPWLGNVSCDEPARGVELPITSALWLGLVLKTTSVWYVHAHSSKATSFEDQARSELHMAARVHDCAPGQGSGHETCPFSINSVFASSACSVDASCCVGRGRWSPARAPSRRQHVVRPSRPRGGGTLLQGTCLYRYLYRYLYLRSTSHVARRSIHVHMHANAASWANGRAISRC
jgi:hypothetical protein